MLVHVLYDYGVIELLLVECWISHYFIFGTYRGRRKKVATSFSLEFGKNFVKS